MKYKPILFHSIDDENPYLYLSRYGLGTFVHLEVEFRSINSLCYKQERAVFEEIEAMKKMTERIDRGEETFEEEELGDITDDIRMGLDCDIPEWQAFFAIHVRAGNLLLFYTFLEWALKQICEDCTENKIPKTNKSKIKNYLSVIESTYQTKIPITSESEENMESLRVIRNQYAHGNWSEVGETLESMDIIAVLKSISAILSAIEDIIETNPEITSRIWQSGNPN